MQAILTECSCFVVEKKRTTFAITAVELYREKNIAMAITIQI